MVMEGKTLRREKDTAGPCDNGPISNDNAGVIVLPPLTILPLLLAGLLLHFLWMPLRFFQSGGSAMLSDGRWLWQASCCLNGRSGRCFAQAWTPILISRLPRLSLPDLTL